MILELDPKFETFKLLTEFLTALSPNQFIIQSREQLDLLHEFSDKIAKELTAKHENYYYVYSETKL